MLKKFCTGIMLFFSLCPTILANQFSECSSQNDQKLQQALDAISSTYPETLRQIISSPVQTFISTPHDYGAESINKRFIYKGNERIQGVMVNYFLHKKDKDLAQLSQDIQLMKKEGIIGISLEVPWYEYETQDNVFTPPTYIEKALDIIEQNGLYSTILLSPHYTPDWFFEKLGDVYMHRPDQRPIIWDNLRTLVPEAGAYLTYSPFAEKAIDEQIAFDINAVQHYEKRPSVIAIFLSNEQTYPKEIAVDYSSFAATAWKSYLATQHHSDIPLPTDKNSSDYRLFEHFLQDGLNNLHLKILTAVQAQQKTQVPVTDRLLLYESMSDNAHKYHQRPLISEDPSQIIANDIYGFTPNVFALQYNYQKPVIIAETNMLGICSSNAMYDYMLLQFLHGSSVLSVFKWQRGADTYSLLNPDGSIKESSRGVFAAAKKIQQLTMLQYPEITRFLQLNREDVLNAARDGKRVDIDKAVESAWKDGHLPGIQWTDEHTAPHAEPIISNSIIGVFVFILAAAIVVAKVFY